MIQIFHGDDQVNSRQAYFHYLDTLKDSEVLKIEGKTLDLDKLNNSLNAGSLFPGQKVICFESFFSIPKALQDKAHRLLTKSDCQILIWHDKTLTATQLKIFPKAKINLFRAPNSIFACINSIKPYNLSAFQPLYQKVVREEMFDLFLYLLKANFRKQLQTTSRLDSSHLKKTYLQIIELEYQFKSGQSVLDREIALNRTLIPLLR